MKKMEMTLCLMTAGFVGLGTYVLLNKNTKNKADKLINNMLDKANDMTNKMSK